MSKSNLALAQSNPNIGLIQSLYAAFGRGDIASIVASTTPDVHHGASTAARQDIPFLGHHKGHAGVQRVLQGPRRGARHHVVHAAGILRRRRQGVRDRPLWLDHEAERTCRANPTGCTSGRSATARSRRCARSTTPRCWRKRGAANAACSKRLIDLPGLAADAREALLGRVVLLVDVERLGVGAGGLLLVAEPLVGKPAAGPGVEASAARPARRRRDRSPRPWSRSARGGSSRAR